VERSATHRSKAVSVGCAPLHTTLRRAYRNRFLGEDKDHEEKAEMNPGTLQCRDARKPMFRNGFLHFPVRSGLEPSLTGSVSSLESPVGSRPAGR